MNCILLSISLERHIRLVVQYPQHEQADLLVECQINMSAGLWLENLESLQVFVVLLVSKPDPVSEPLQVRGRLLLEVFCVEGRPRLGARVVLLELVPLSQQVLVVEHVLEHDNGVGVLVVVHLEELFHVGITLLDQLLHLVLHQFELELAVL